MVDHHTSSHMPASMIDGCSLSRTKWKVHAFELDKGLVCLPDKCVSLMCSSLLTCRESSPLPLQGFFCWKCTLREKVTCALLREFPWWAVTWLQAPNAHTRAHKLFHIVLPSTDCRQEDHSSLPLLDQYLFQREWLFIDSTSSFCCSGLFGSTTFWDSCVFSDHV